MVLVLAVGVDFGSGPVEDPEGVVGSEIDEREGNGTRPGFPCGRIGEEEVADEVIVEGIGRGVNSEPIEVGGGVNAGPVNEDGVAGFGEDGGVHRDGDLGLEGGVEEEEEEVEKECERNHG